MVYIDFTGGAHGHFLEFIILKHVLRHPAYENFTPFTSLGTAHIKPSLIDKSVFARHWTEHVPRAKFLADDLVIRIPVDPESIYLYFIFVGNSITRVADITLDLDQLEKNTLEKIPEQKHSNLKKTIMNELGIIRDYPRSKLRNIFYDRIRQRSIKFVDFQAFGAKSIAFNFDSFYNWADFLAGTNNIATALDLPQVDANRLQCDYQEFLKNNAVYWMQENVKALFTAILDDTLYSCSLNILEEAFLNVLITREFNIHSGLSTFKDYYTAEPTAISAEIKRVLKNRNVDFDTAIPISQQLDRVVLEF